MFSIKAVRKWLIVSSFLVILCGMWEIISSIIVWTSNWNETNSITTPILGFIFGVLTIISGVSGIKATKRYNESALSCFACSSVCWFIIYMIGGIVMIVATNQLDTKAICNGDICIYYDDNGITYRYTRGEMTYWRLYAIIALIIAAFFFTNVILACVISNHPDKRRIAQDQITGGDNYHLHVDNHQIAPNHDQYIINPSHHHGHHGNHGHHGQPVHHGHNYIDNHAIAPILPNQNYVPNQNLQNALYGQPVNYSQPMAQEPIYYNQQPVIYNQPDDQQQQQMNQNYRPYPNNFNNNNQIEYAKDPYYRT